MEEINFYKTNEECMDFFIPSSFYGEDAEENYEELVFSVPKSLVEKYLESHFITTNVYKWRKEEWLWEDADEILNKALIENKVVALSYEK